MALLHCEVLIPSGTGIPADRGVNSWDFDALDDSAGMTAGLSAALLAFYDDVVGAQTAELTSRMRLGIVQEQWLARWFSRSAVTGELTPLREVPLNTTNLAAVGDALPTECALRMSLHGVLTGVQATDRRRRGGPFLGPGWLASIVQISSGRSVPDDALVSDMGIAIEGLQAAAIVENAGLIVWSQADLVQWPVDGWFVDNAFDTIRSRGTAATSRESGNF